MSTSPEAKKIARENIRRIAAEFKGRGDQLGWFDAVYRESGGDLEKIPWADLEPNRFFRAWAEKTGLKGEGRKALVVGCGLGDDARYLFDQGFDVTAFDISETAIDWAERLHQGTDIRFEVANLFEPFRGWIGAFDFVLEIYTIQPLPMEMRSRAIDSVAGFVAPGGELLVVCRGRCDGEDVEEIPYPLSPAELKRFEENGLEQIEFDETIDDEDQRRFVIRYKRN